MLARCAICNIYGHDDICVCGENLCDRCAQWFIRCRFEAFIRRQLRLDGLLEKMCE